MSDAQRHDIEAEVSQPPWCPDECPITGLPFFMLIEHPDMGIVPTYGGPFDSYTLPGRGDIERIKEVGMSYMTFLRARYDHDLGGWVEGWEQLNIVAVDETDLLELIP